MQVIEYRYEATDWDTATTGGNRITNGSMDPVRRPIPGAEMALVPCQGVIDGWKTFVIDPGTTHQQVTDDVAEDNWIARISGGSATGKTVDGGYVQRIGQLSQLETYRLSGRVRSTWAVDERHYCAVGYDLTGQDADPQARTIHWTRLPAIHGRFVP